MLNFNNYRQSSFGWNTFVHSLYKLSWYIFNQCLHNRNICNFKIKVCADSFAGVSFIFFYSFQVSFLCLHQSPLSLESNFIRTNFSNFTVILMTTAFHIVIVNFSFVFLMVLSLFFPFLQFISIFKVIEIHTSVNRTCVHVSHYLSYTSIQLMLNNEHLSN